MSEEIPLEKFAKLMKHTRVKTESRNSACGKQGRYKESQI